jgi:hypothetical protein
MKIMFTALMFIVLAAGSAAAQKKFYSKEFKVGFTTPANSKLASDEIAPEKMKTVTHVELLGTGKKVGGSATIAAGAMTQADCKVFSRSDGDKPRRRKFGTITFDKVTDNDPGMEGTANLEIYHTFHNGVCYEVSLKVGGAKYRKTNDQAIFNRLYVILRTFHFGS